MINIDTLEDKLRQDWLRRKRIDKLTFIKKGLEKLKDDLAKSEDWWSIKPYLKITLGIPTFGKQSTFMSLGESEEGFFHIPHILDNVLDKKNLYEILGPVILERLDKLVEEIDLELNSLLGGNR